MKKVIAILCLIAILAVVSCCFVGCVKSEPEDLISEDEQWSYRHTVDTVEVSVTNQTKINKYVKEGYEIIATDGKHSTLQRTTYSLLAYLGDESEVTVPATVDGHKIDTYESGLFLKQADNSNRRLRETYTANETLVTVTFAEGVDVIPDLACYMCVNLQTVNISSTVKKIGDFSFFGCGKLESISIPSSVNHIGAYTFRECASLKTVNISVASDSEFPPYLGDYCFYMVDEKSFNNDQYYIIPDLKIVVDRPELFDNDYLTKAFRENKNNDYRNWKIYIGYLEKKTSKKIIVYPCYVYDTNGDPVFQPEYDADGNPIYKD